MSQSADKPAHSKAWRLIAAVLFLLVAKVSSRAQSYSIDWHTIDGGGRTSSGGSYTLSGTLGQPDANSEPMTGGNFSLTGGFWSLFPLQTVEVTVRGRYLFYNQSAFDGNNPAANPQDDGAIAIDKRPLLPGQTASFANYTSYSKGINGIMIDIAGLVGIPSANDFTFKIGNSSDLATWTTAPAPLSIYVRPGAGTDGSSRVTILWPNNAIQKQWLQITVLATAVTGLGAPDLFYFGNAIGESGNSATEARVNATDEIIARNNARAAGQAPIDFRYDYNRDGKVNATDEIIARNNATSSLTALQLVNAPQVISGATRSTLASASLQLTTANPPPVIHMAKVEADGRLHIRFSGMSGHIYVVEGVENLARPAWVELVPQPPLSQSGNGYEFVVDLERGNPMRFYRVLIRN